MNMFHKPFNHLLRNQTWARDKLKPFAGKTVRFNISSFQFVFVITDIGEIAPSDSAPDAEITVDASFIPQLISGNASPSSEIKIIGDPDLAAAAAFVFRNLKWDIEEDLSQVFGDIAAHRITSLGSQLLNWGRSVHESVSLSLAEYLKEEKSVLVKSSDMDLFLKEVDALREATDRLEKRITRLAK